MASIFDVAAYILAKWGTMPIGKLQKLCYYAQAWSLVWDNQPLFDEDFEAWGNGPVCVSLNEAIGTTYNASPNVSPKQLKLGHADVFDPTQKETIDAVLDFYGDRGLPWLCQLAHLEDPWKVARDGCPFGEPCHNVISKELMKRYYAALYDEDRR